MHLEKYVDIKVSINKHNKNVFLRMFYKMRKKNKFSIIKVY